MPFREEYFNFVGLRPAIRWLQHGNGSGEQEIVVDCPLVRTMSKCWPQNHSAKSSKRTSTFHLVHDHDFLPDFSGNVRGQIFNLVGRCDDLDIFNIAHVKRRDLADERQ